MRRPTQPTRPDLIRARAVLEAMRGPDGNDLRTVAQAVAWIDKMQPELTENWFAWMGKPIKKKKKDPAPLPS